MTLRIASRLPLRYSPASRVAFVGSKISLSCSVNSPASPGEYTDCWLPSSMQKDFIMATSCIQQGVVHCKQMAAAYMLQGQEAFQWMGGYSAIRQETTEGKRGTCSEGLAAGPHLTPVAHGFLIAGAHCVRLIRALQQILHLAAQPRRLFWRQGSQLSLLIICIHSIMKSCFPCQQQVHYSRILATRVVCLALRIHHSIVQIHLFPRSSINIRSQTHSSTIA